MGRQSSACETSLLALKTTGRIEAVDEATVALARGLADALDEVDPGASTYPQLARQYALVWQQLRGGEHDAAGFEALVERLASSGSATLGHTENPE